MDMRADDMLRVVTINGCDDAVSYVIVTGASNESVTATTRTDRFMADAPTNAERGILGILAELHEQGHVAYVPDTGELYLAQLGSQQW